MPKGNPIRYEKRVNTQLKLEDYKKMIHIIELYPERWDNVSHYLRSCIIMINRLVLSHSLDKVMEDVRK